MQRKNSPPEVSSNNAPLQSGGAYEGFLQDLLDTLATDLEFDYFVEEDLIHGYPTPDGNWTGLIGSLVDRVSNYLGTTTRWRGRVLNFYVFIEVTCED